jgi:hypothetical protein
MNADAERVAVGILLKRQLKRGACRHLRTLGQLSAAWVYSLVLWAAKFQKIARHVGLAAIGLSVSSKKELLNGSITRLMAALVTTSSALVSASDRRMTAQLHA